MGFLQANTLTNLWKREGRKNSITSVRSWDADPQKAAATAAPPEAEAQKQNAFKVVLFDWVMLALLGALMAACSLAMDFLIEYLSNLHLSVMLWAHGEREGLWSGMLAFFAWTGFTVLCTTIASAFVLHVSRPAVGSGIAEMKTILRGFRLEGYLEIKCLFAVMVGLCFSLGSGIPIAKAGPFVHAAAILAKMITNLAKSINPEGASEERVAELLSAGCAVGVACVFSSPVGAVLFSIETTSVYFAVRNYWRGFFGAACATVSYRLLRVALQLDLTVTSEYLTWFPKEAFFPEELPLFAIMGMVCGFGASVFVKMYRKMELLRRLDGPTKRFFDRHWTLFPIFGALVVSIFNYPLGLGNYIGGDRKFVFSGKDFFQNCTWSDLGENATNRCGDEIVHDWLDDGNLNAFVVLGCFFVLTALAVCLPIPCGVFGPAFAIGAAFGRMIGEAVAIAFPYGVREGVNTLPVYPGVYAVVGAAAFCGGVTHSISVAILAYEITGQMIFILPVMIAVLAGNAVASYLGPSFYDVLIEVKKLPFVPDIPKNINVDRLTAERFMTRNPKSLTPDAHFLDLRPFAAKSCPYSAIPVIDSRESGVLIGVIDRLKLRKAFIQQVGGEARRAEARRRYYEELVRQQRLVPDTPDSTSSGSTEQSTQSTTEGSTRDLISGVTVTHKAAKAAAAEMEERRREAEADLEFDLTGEDRKQWEEERLSEPLDLNSLDMDSTPFQLQANMPLTKIHSMFSMLGLRRAFITQRGRLVGVVTLQDLRFTLEKLHKNQQHDSVFANAGRFARRASAAFLSKPPTEHQRQSVTPAAPMSEIIEVEDESDEEEKPPAEKNEKRRFSFFPRS